MSQYGYEQLPPDVQPPSYAEVARQEGKKGTLIGNPFLTVVGRSAQIFMFWFVIIMILGFVYNEVVVSETMLHWTGNPSHVEYESEEERAIMDTDYDKYRFDNHQIISFSASLAAVMLLTRFFLEGLCFYVGKEVCANVSGQAIYAQGATQYGQDGEQQQQPTQVQAVQQAVYEQPPPPPTRQEQLAPPSSLDSGYSQGGGFVAATGFSRMGRRHRY